MAIVVGAAGYDLGTHSKTATAPPQHPAAGGAAATSAPPAGPPPCAASVTASIGDSRLLSELLPVPPGATRPTGSPAPKVYTLNAYVAALYAPGPVAIQEKALLTGRCFQTAVNGQWLTSTGTLVSIWLVQFAVTSGAESYALGQQNKDVQLMGAHGRTKLVRGVRAWLIEDNGLDAAGNTTARLFGYVGPVMILIHVFTPGSVAAEPPLAALLREQAARL